MSDNNTQNHGAKIAALETSISGINGRLDGLTRAVDSLATAYTTSQRTDWQTIFAGASILLALGGALWIAGINPVTHDVARLTMEKERLADAVIEQNRVIALGEREMAAQGANADKRMSIIEWRLTLKP
jgi:hypothetical protein